MSEFDKFVIWYLVFNTASCALISAFTEYEKSDPPTDGRFWLKIYFGGLALVGAIITGVLFVR